MKEINKYDSMAKTYEDQYLTKNEKLIYVYLILLHNNIKGYAYPSYSSLKKALSTTRDDTVSKVVKSLEEKEYIERDISPGRNTKYYLLKNIKSTTKNESTTENEGTTKSEGATTTENEGIPLRKVKDNSINIGLNNSINTSTNKKASKKSNKTYIDLSHMEIEYIKLTQEEYNKLVEKYTEGLVKKKLIDMESYEANRKKKYLDHYKALCSWLNKEKPKEQQLYDKPMGKVIEMKIGEG
ncbi:MAG: helix-turn-helix domain-containing protein [Peptostreptococcaceae bacterium]|nr:helix-turn-helix domain-containing protein [Peptostreptococcaceae bacterium]